MVEPISFKSKLSMFLKGVFWTTYIGMAAFIFWPQEVSPSESGYEISKRVPLDQLFGRISVADLPGTLDDNDGR